MDLRFNVGQMDGWKGHSNHSPIFFPCVLQFFRGLVRFVELRTETHTLRHSNKKKVKAYICL